MTLEISCIPLSGSFLLRPAELWIMVTSAPFSKEMAIKWQIVRLSMTICIPGGSAVIGEKVSSAGQSAWCARSDTVYRAKLGQVTPDAFTGRAGTGNYCIDQHAQYQVSFGGGVGTSQQHIFEVKDIQTFPLRHMKSTAALIILDVGSYSSRSVNFIPFHGFFSGFIARHAHDQGCRDRRCTAQAYATRTRGEGVASTSKSLTAHQPRRQKQR